MGLTATIDQYGSGALRVEWRAPEPLAPESVRVQMRALSLNYRDLLVVRGQYGSGVRLPLVPGSDGAGEIVEVGSKVSQFSPGDRVCTHMTPAWHDGPLRAEMRSSTLGGPSDGVFAQERVLPATALVSIPDDLGFSSAACLPVAGLTAWSALREAGLTDPGPHNRRRVLLLGTGGVSVLGLQLALALGHHCAVVSASEAKRSQASALGAELVLDRDDSRWPAAVRRWSNGGVDLVLEVGGDGTFDQSLSATRDNGCIALIGVLAQQGRPVRLEEVLMRRIKVQGIFVGSRAELESLVAFAARAQLRPYIGRQFEGLEHIKLAFAAVQAGRHFGKCVVNLGLEPGDSPDRPAMHGC